MIVYGESNPIYPRYQVKMFRIALIPYAFVVDFRQSILKLSRIMETE